MALAEDLRTLRDRALAELDAAHDYYIDTRGAWGIVHKVVWGGTKIIIRNTATGNVTTETALAEKARR